MPPTILGHTMTMPSSIQCLPIDGGGGSDDEDMHKRKQCGSKLSVEDKRSQHCEVEKRRREKMNRYMAELAQMIPACNAVPRKLDKLSILKMAVEHMKNLRGDPHSSSEYKPGFLTDDELKQLVVEAANGFMIIISCEKARVLFVSDTINEVLHQSPDNWLGSSFYDLLHPKDVQKIKEQLACFDVEEALAASVKHNCNKSPLVMHPQSMNGLRRSFLCRVKREDSSHELPDSTTSSSQSAIPDSLSGEDFNKPENMIRLIHSSSNDPSSMHQYAVLHCTGFIRNLTPAERQSLRVEKEETGACLVAVARLQHFGETAPRHAMSSNDKEFVTRVGTDGRFTYVDQRITNVLGYLPQDLTGQVSYEYFHHEDMQKMVHLHHEALKQRRPMPTVHYRFLSKNQKWVWLAMKAFSFINPFSQQVEYVVCTNVAHTRPVDNGEECASTTSGALDTIITDEPTLPSDIASILPDLGPNIQSWSGTSQNDFSFPMEATSTTNSIPVVSASTSSAQLTQPIVVVSQSADITVEQNAVTAQKIVDEYIKMTAPPPHRKDMNYSFPAGLFPGEVDLEGSAQAYHHLIDGLEENQDLQQILNQIDADPFRPSSVFGDLEFDLFD